MRPLVKPPTTSSEDIRCLFGGILVHFHGLVLLFRSLMYEAGLGKVMSGTETIPAALADSTPGNVAAQEAAALALTDKNGKPYTRLLLVTSDCPEGYSSAASQVVQSFAPIGTEEFGDGRDAFLALEAKYRADSAFRMHELQDQLGSLAVTADDKFDPARAIQRLRPISTELDALGDKVVPTRKTHAFLYALPEKHYGSL